MKKLLLPFLIPFCLLSKEADKDNTLLRDEGTNNTTLIGGQNTPSTPRPPVQTRRNSSRRRTYLYGRRRLRSNRGSGSITVAIRSEQDMRQLLAMLRQSRPPSVTAYVFGQSTGLSYSSRQ